MAHIVRVEPNTIEMHLFLENQTVFQFFLELHRTHFFMNSNNKNVSSPRSCLLAVTSVGTQLIYHLVSDFYCVVSNLDQAEI